jgi:molybdopterin-guanine dinucleotide biosynthesis protein A
MGEDKALLPWGSATLLDHAIARLRDVTADVHILSGADRRYTDRGLPVHLDAVPGQGPLGGLAAALQAAEGRPALLLAVDLPLVTAPLLRRLAALVAHADVVVPVSPGGEEPLCAAYGPACAAAVADALGSGRRRMNSFWPGLRVHRLEGDALAEFGDPARLFRNLNDPGEYRSARRDAE